MSKQLQLGLVIEGNARDSTVLHLPSVTWELGPVKSTSTRVARRLSNVLRAGYAVAEFEELQASELVFLRVPDVSVSRVVDELCSSDLTFKDLSFALCESWLPVDVLEPLLNRGASVATLTKVRALSPDWYVLEGNAKAVRLVRRFLSQNGANATELAAGSKHLFFTSELLVTALPVPLFVSAQQALRACGISGNVLSELLERMAQKMLQDFMRGARGNWGGPLLESLPDTAHEFLEHLRTTQTELAALVDRHLETAQQVMDVWKHKRSVCPNLHLRSLKSRLRNRHLPNS
jgi:hypothetical protein